MQPARIGLSTATISTQAHRLSSKHGLHLHCDLQSRTIFGSFVTCTSNSHITCVNDSHAML